MFGRMRAAVTILLAGLGAVAAGSVRPPNVVLIISDDQGYADFGFLGHPHIRTPHLDRLARQGAVFPHGYVTVPLCRPSLASILTGRYAHQLGICGNDPPDGVNRSSSDRFLRDVPTIPRLLARAGYRSLQTGKWWEGSFANGGFTDGMTPAGERHGGPGLAIGRESLRPIYDFIESAERGNAPFFVWYAPMLPHEPHNPPERILRKYLVPGRNERLARYWAMCEWFDETCGELVNWLDRRRLLDNTMIVFLVDNGWIQATQPTSRGAGGFAPRSKRTPYEGGVRTPVVVWRPGHVRPGRYDDLVSSVDVAPTILRACNVAPPAEMAGLDLCDLANGRPHAARNAVFGEVFLHTDAVLGDPGRNLTHRWVREGRWKLIVPADPAAAAELYDLVKDPDEERNAAATASDVMTRLRRVLDAWWSP